MPVGLPAEDVESSGSEEEGDGGGDKKKRPSRAAVKDVRLRVLNAMRQEQIDSDESDQDFGFNAQNPEQEDEHIDSTEIDSASEIEGNGEKNGAGNEKPADENRPTTATTSTTKKRKRSEPAEGAKSSSPKSEPPNSKRVNNTNFQ